jgi:hypothetical protein
MIQTPWAEEHHAAPGFALRLEFGVRPSATPLSRHAQHDVAQRGERLASE